MVNKIIKRSGKIEYAEGEDGLLDIRSGKEFGIALLLCGGIATVAALSPALLAAAIPVAAMYNKEKEKVTEKKFKNSFGYLKHKGYIKVLSERGRVSIVLTDKGKERAMKNSLAFSVRGIVKPKQWDKKWRILIFDIPANQRLVRDAFRHMIKKLGMRQLQKSVWVYPFDCREQVNFIASFFDLSDANVRLITTTSIGDDKKLRKHFGI